MDITVSYLDYYMTFDELKIRAMFNFESIKETS